MATPVLYVPALPIGSNQATAFLIAPGPAVGSTLWEPRQPTTRSGAFRLGVRADPTRAPRHRPFCRHRARVIGNLGEGPFKRSFAFRHTANRGASVCSYANQHSNWPANSDPCYQQRLSALSTARRSTRSTHSWNTSKNPPPPPTAPASTGQASLELPDRHPHPRSGLSHKGFRIPSSPSPLRMITPRLTDK